MTMGECRIRAVGLTVLAAVLLLGGDGCASADSEKAGAAPRKGPVAAKGRAQLWSENCQRCHNARPASWYSEREWEVAMHHMLVRGYLTRHEHDSVMEFFRAAR